MENQEFDREQAGNRSLLNSLPYFKNLCDWQLAHQGGLSDMGAMVNTRSIDLQNRQASLYLPRYHDIGPIYSDDNTDKRVMCGICYKMFCNRSSLRVHNSSVHLKRKYQCTVKGCGRLFTTQYSRNRHSRNQKKHSKRVGEINIGHNYNYAPIFPVPALHNLLYNSAPLLPPPVAARFGLPQMGMSTFPHFGQISSMPERLDVGHNHPRAQSCNLQPSPDLLRSHNVRAPHTQTHYN